MGKMKVSRNVAETIQQLLKKVTKEQLLIQRVYELNLDGPSGPLRELSVDELATALYAGYTIVETPEERAVYYYNKLKNSPSSDEQNMAMAIRHALNLLNQRIEGINA